MKTMCVSAVRTASVTSLCSSSSKSMLRESKGDAVALPPVVFFQRKKGGYEAVRVRNTVGMQSPSKVTTHCTPGKHRVTSTDWQAFPVRNVRPAFCMYYNSSAFVKLLQGKNSMSFMPVLHRRRLICSPSH